MVWYRYRLNQPAMQTKQRYRGSGDDVQPIQLHMLA